MGIAKVSEDASEPLCKCLRRGSDKDGEQFVVLHKINLANFYELIEEVLSPSRV